MTTTPAASARRERQTRVPDRLTDLVRVVTVVFGVWVALVVLAIWITSGLAYFTGNL